MHVVYAKCRDAKNLPSSFHPNPFLSLYLLPLMQCFKETLQSKFCSSFFKSLQGLGQRPKVFLSQTLFSRSHLSPYSLLGAWGIAPKNGSRGETPCRVLGQSPKVFLSQTLFSRSRLSPYPLLGAWGIAPKEWSRGEAPCRAWDSVPRSFQTTPLLSPHLSHVSSPSGFGAEPQIMGQGVKPLAGCWGRAPNNGSRGEAPCRAWGRAPRSFRTTPLLSASPVPCILPFGVWGRAPKNGSRGEAPCGVLGQSPKVLRIFLVQYL